MTAAPTQPPQPPRRCWALADRPAATATELAEAAGIGRSTAAKLLATLASQGRVLRQPGGDHDGRRAADRWALPTPVPTQDPGAPPTVAPTPPAEPPPTEAGRLGAGQLRQLVLSCLAERPGRRCRPPRSPRHWTARPARSPTPCGSWPAKVR